MTDVAVTDVTTVVRTAVPVATTTMPTRRPMPNSIWLTTSPHLARLCATTPIIDSLGPSTKVPLVGLSWLKTNSYNSYIFSRPRYTHTTVVFICTMCTHKLTQRLSCVFLRLFDQFCGFWTTFL